MSGEEELNFDELDAQFGEEETPAEEPVSDKAMFAYGKDEENPFAKVFKERYFNHKFPGGTKEKKFADSKPEVFGFHVKEIKETKVPKDNGDPNVFLQGTAYYETYKRNELLYPPGGLVTGLKTILGVPKEDIHKIKMTVELFKPLEGKFLFIDYHGKFPHPDVKKKGKYYHKIFVAEHDLKK